MTPLFYALAEFDELANSIHYTRDNFPKMNFYRVGENFFLDFALAGYDKKDVSITINERAILEIKYKSEKKTEDAIFFRKEISEKDFSRKIQLPDFLDFNSLESSFENGMLKLKFSLRDDRKKIEITFKD